MTTRRYRDDDYPEGETSSAAFWNKKSDTMDREILFDRLFDAGMDDAAYAVLDGTISLTDGQALLPTPKPKRELTPEEIEKMLGM
jgi:hypothetical protein